MSGRTHPSSQSTQLVIRDTVRLIHTNPEYLEEVWRLFAAEPQAFLCLAQAFSQPDVLRGVLGALPPNDRRDAGQRNERPGRLGALLQSTPSERAAMARDEGGEERREEVIMRLVNKLRARPLMDVGVVSPIQEAMEARLGDLTALTPRRVPVEPPQRTEPAQPPPEDEISQSDADDDTTSDTDIPPHLREFVDEDDDGEDLEDGRGELISAQEAAQQLHMHRQTVYKWVDEGKLLGWRLPTKQRIRVPKEQILGSGHVVGGIQELLQIIDVPEVAWNFLDEPHSFSGGVERPIEMLLRGQKDEVLEAARSYGMTMGD